MNLAGFYPESISNGEGFRAVLYVSGCPHACPGCHNAQTQDACYGELFTDEKRAQLVNEIAENSILKGITLSGGEPFWEPNVAQVLAFTKEVLAVRPDLNVWAYSGYKYEQLLKRDDLASRELLSLVDVLVDGKYVQEKRDPNLRFKGSSNQRIIDVKASMHKRHVVLYRFTSILDDLKIA